MEELLSVTSFKVAGEYFAFPTQTIRHILENVNTTRVPLSKPCIRGVINYHGNMIPVADMRVIIGKEPDDSFPEQSIVVIGVPDAGKEELLGFKVDEMDDVFEYTPENFKSEIVIDIDPIAQRALQGTISHAGKFIYLVKSLELIKALD